MTAPASSVAEAARPVAGFRADLVTALLGAWFSIGLFLDAWAHNTNPGLETFFTPWHAVFYSGFIATAAWALWVCRGALQPAPGTRAITAVPIGYGPTLFASFGFALAGVGDFIWHTVFGIEQHVNILFSPTHLALVATMFIIVTTPVRAAWANPDLPPSSGLRPLLPAILSSAFAATLVLLFLQYGNVLTFRSRGVVDALTGDSGLTFTFITSLVVTNLVLVVPLLVLARRWLPPVGTATMLYLAVGGLSAAVTGLRNVPLIVALVVAGTVVDGLVRLLRPTPERRYHYRAFGALAPLATWVIFLVAAYVTAGPAESEFGRTGHPEAVVELVTGAPLVQSLLGLLAAVLLLPLPAPVAPLRVEPDPSH